jgi:hypothetical protein
MKRTLGKKGCIAPRTCCAGSAGEAGVPTEAGLAAQGGGEKGVSPWIRELSCATVISPSAVCAPAACSSQQ